MTPVRKLARRMLQAAVARAHPDARDWAEAMLRELDFIASDWSALAWSIGSVRSIFAMRKGREAMRGQINRVSSRVVVALSLIALFTVLAGYLQPAHQPVIGRPDEGTGAHIFQIAIVLLAPTILAFLATADWKQPWRSARPLTIPAVALVLAFAALYYLEHFYLAPL